MRPLLACLILALSLAAACSESATSSQNHPSGSATLAVSGSYGGHLTAGIPDGAVEARVTRVVDGDTIEVEIGGDNETLRYIGMDTPETVDPNRPVGCYGPEASAHNKELVDGKTVWLEKDVSETDKYGRLLRYVWLPGDETPSGQAEMVNADLVRDGYAKSVHYPPDTGRQDTFDALQAEAQSAGRGLWSVCADATPAPTQSPPPPSGDEVCDFSGTTQAVIKGNISSGDEKIYHVPGQQSYAETQINEARGERWFCAEADAVAAGWRKSKS